MFTPPYRQLARFSGNLAMGIDSALTMPRAFSVALRSLHRTRITRAMVEPVESVRAGNSIADTLKQAEQHLPAFVIPTIRSGEETGRLDEALRFLERHCDMLTGPANAIRNAWLVPLCILFIGDLACVVMNLGMGSITGAVHFIVAAVIRWALFAIVVWIALRPMFKPYFDRVRLRLPWYSKIERDIASHRFFRILSLLYGVSDAPVDRMIDTAADSISNLAARDEFRKAANAIRRQTTVEEAFERPQFVVDDEQRSSIAAGEIAGKLESTFGLIADTTCESLKLKLRVLEQFTFRLAMLTAVSAIIGVAFRLM